MKRTEIKSHEILAHQRGSYDYPSPVAVIDTETLWTRQHSLSSTSYSRAAGWKCSYDRLYRRATGWLVVRPDLSGPQLDQALELLRQWLAALPEEINETVVNDLANRMPDGLYLSIAASRDLRGDWESVKAAEDAKRKIQRREEEARRRHLSARRARIDEVKTAISARTGAPSTVSDAGGDRVAIDLAVLKQLLDATTTTPERTER